MSPGVVRVRRVGHDAVLLELDSDDQVRSALAEATSQRDRGQLQAVDIVPAARTLLLDGVDADAVIGQVSSWDLADASPLDGVLVSLPTVYDGADLEDVARRWDCTRDEVAAFHAGLEHVVAFCGFAPGFAYCTGLPAEREVPRREVPRTTVPAGAVGLAGGYTGVYPRPSPGGWQLIGRVLEPVWREDEPDPVLLQPGTRVRFVP